jgi:hypothetical protein
MDRELEPADALALEHHVRVCMACSARADEYREISRSFADYYRAIATRKNSRRLRWAVWSATVGVAATAAMIMLMLRPRVETNAVPASGCPESTCDGFSNRASESPGAGRTDSPAARAEQCRGFTTGVEHGAFCTNSDTSRSSVRSWRGATRIQLRGGTQYRQRRIGESTKASAMTLIQIGD